MDIRRIEKTINRFDEHFAKKVFTFKELLIAKSRKGHGNGYVRSLATKFAGKEATAKALGTGIAKGVYWKNIEILALDSGQPIVNLNGSALSRLANMMPDSLKSKISITISDEYPIVSAIVIISCH